MAFACGIDWTKDARQLIDFIWLDYELKISWILEDIFVLLEIRGKNLLKTVKKMKKILLLKYIKREFVI